MLFLAPAACSRAPTQDILGSFFPVWILCGGIGAFIAVVVRQILVLTTVDQYLIAPAVSYLAIALAASMLVWLLWFGR